MHSGSQASSLLPTFITFPLLAVGARDPQDPIDGVGSHWIIGGAGNRRGGRAGNWTGGRKKYHQDSGCDRRPKPQGWGQREAEGMRWGWGAHSLLSLRFKGEQVAAYNSGSSLLSTLGLVGTSPPRPSLQTWRFHSLTVG